MLSDRYRMSLMRTLYRTSSTTLVVDGGTIAWLGTATPTGPVDAVVELGDAVLTPAFVDAHVHTTEVGLVLTGLDLRDAASVTDILGRVERVTRARGGRPVLGHGWDEALLAEGRPPTRAELDRAAAGGVVYLSRVDVHSAVVSSALAEAAGVRPLEGWTEDGRVERDAHHAVRAATRDHLPAADRREAQLAALRAAAAAGIVELHEMSAPHIAPEGDLAALLELVRDADLPRVVPYRGQLVATAEEARALLDRLPTGVVGLAGDLCVDGSVGSRTAAFRADYADAPGNRGHLYLTVEQVRDHVVACTRVGVQAGFHVIGDAGVETVLRGVRRAAERVGLAAVRAAGHRLEHLEALDAELVREVADLGLTASVQPAFDALWGGATGMYAQRLGAERALAMNPFAGLAAAGVRLLLGSDAPVTPFDPWGAVRACVRHHVPEQRLSARAAFGAHSTPGLTVGGPATFAAWQVDGDVARAGGPDGLPDLVAGAASNPECVLTLRDGRVLHAAAPGNDLMHVDG